MEKKTLGEIMASISPLKVYEKLHYTKVKNAYDNNTGEYLTLNEILDFINYGKANGFN